MIPALETQPAFSPVSAPARSSWWILAGVCALLLSVIAFYFDATVQSWTAAHQTSQGMALMRAVSRWGDWPGHVFVGFVGGAIAYAIGDRRWLAIFAAMVLACTIAGAVNRMVKITAGRARPTVLVDKGWNGPRLGSKYHSFASGHTACSVAFFAVLCFARPRLGLLFLPVPLLIAASRLYQNAHFLSDVVCGAILGLLCALFVWRFVSARLGVRTLVSSPP